MRLQKLIVILAVVWMAAFCYGLDRDTVMPNRNLD